MPLYEFLCPKCNKIVEIIKNIDDNRQEICPECREIMAKLVSKSSFVLKGSGWARDGYQRKEEK